MRVLILTGNECLALPVQPGTVLACTSGRVWVTFEAAQGQKPCPDDVLPPGGTWRARQAGTLFLSRLRSAATTPAVVQVIARGKRDRLPAGGDERSAIAGDAARPGRTAPVAPAG